MTDKKLVAITAMLNSFPQSIRDNELLLRTYRALLDEVSLDAVQDAAKRYAAGYVPGQSKTFAPSTAEFCEKAREFDKLQALKNRPRIQPPVHVKRGSYFERQEAVRAQYADYSVLCEDVTYENYLKLRRTLKNPHFFVPQLGTIYAGLHPKMSDPKPAPKPHSEVQA